MVSRLEVEGDKLVKQLVNQVDDFGGALCYITGAMGGGKTSALFFFTSYTLRNYSDQKTFLSETYDSPLQAFKLGKDVLHFMVMEGSDVMFRDRNRHLKEVDLNPTYFKADKKQINYKNKYTDEMETKTIYKPDFVDLYKKAKPGKANVVFFGRRMKWMEFIAFLRHTGEWNHVFIDEIGELIPANTSGHLHRRVAEFTNFCKDVRKCKLKVIGDTQSVRDMDWRVRDKFMYRIFLPGSLADKKHSRVTQRAIDKLQGSEEKGNDAYIDSRGKFGLITFTDIFSPKKDFSIEAHVQTSEEYHIFDDE